MKDLDVYLLLILVIIGIGSCSFYSVQRVDAIVENMIATSIEVRK